MRKGGVIPISKNSIILTIIIIIYYSYYLIIQIFSFSDFDQDSSWQIRKVKVYFRISNLHNSFIPVWSHWISMTDRQFICLQEISLLGYILCTSLHILSLQVSYNKLTIFVIGPICAKDIGVTGQTLRQTKGQSKFSLAYVALQHLKDIILFVVHVFNDFSQIRKGICYY